MYSNSNAFNRSTTTSEPPSARGFSIFFALLIILSFLGGQRANHPERIRAVSRTRATITASYFRNRHAALYRRPLRNRIEPPFNVGELFELDVMAVVTTDPRVGCHVGN